MNDSEAPRTDNDEENLSLFYVRLNSYWFKHCVIIQMKSERLP